jgi:heat shock protein HslJ
MKVFSLKKAFTFPEPSPVILITTAKVRIFPFVIAAILAVSCGSAPDTPSGANGPVPAAGFSGISGITGKDWKLIEVRSSADASASAGTDTGASRFSRGELAEAGMENAYTLRFDEERLSGMGAPNRYSAPYTQGAGQTLSIGVIASTLMASIREPENLKEREYFDYLENVNKWEFVQGQLRLISRNGRGEETVLIFEADQEEVRRDG